MDSREAKLMVVRSLVLEMEERSSIDLMNKHKKGGMSQMRFNRLRRGAIQAFITEVVSDLRSIEDLDELSGIVVAGPGNAKKQLIEALPQDLREMVIGTMDVDMDSAASELVMLAGEIMEERERIEEAELVNELKGVLSSHPGDAEVYLHLERQVVRLPDAYRVDPSNGLAGELRVLLGPEAVLI